MSNLKVSTLAGLTGASVPIADVVNGTARAWVNFNGTGTVAIRASYNVSSITDNGVGDYTVNFTTAMLDANYSSELGAWTNGGGGIMSGQLATYATNSFRFTLRAYDNTINDATYVNIAIFR